MLLHMRSLVPCSLSAIPNCVHHCTGRRPSPIWMRQRPRLRWRCQLTHQRCACQCSRPGQVSHVHETRHHPTSPTARLTRRVGCGAGSRCSSGGCAGSGRPGTRRAGSRGAGGDRGSSSTAGASSCKWQSPGAASPRTHCQCDWQHSCARTTVHHMSSRQGFDIANRPHS